MAITDAKPLFVDTNILVYANVAESPFHAQALDALQVAHQAGRQLWISRQIVREFIAARTRPQTFAKPSTPQIVIERIRYFEAQFQVADDTSIITAQLLDLLNDYEIGGKQIHDANIVAIMRTYDIPCLLTYNVTDFDRFEDIISIETL